MTEEIKTEISTDCSYYKDVVKDKEILIDGVNVAGCFNLDEWKHCNICQELIKIIPNRHQCLIEEDLRCEFYTNCYYKQLKRLEQENIILKEKLQIAANSDKETLKILQENKELQAYKDINEDFKKAWDELNEKYKQLRSALEEIREVATLDDVNCNISPETMNVSKDVLKIVNKVLNKVDR